MLTLLIATLVWSGTSISSIDILDHARPLHAGSTNRLDIPGFSFEGQAACDKFGNIYMRPTVGSDDTAMVKLSQNGSKQSIYRLLNVDASPESVSFAGFSVTPMGDLWELIQAPDGGHIEVFEFGQEQEARHRTKLEVPPRVHPQKFTVFENGDVLFTGYYDSKAGSTLEGKTYSALFAPTGKLVQIIRNVANDYTYDRNKLPEGMMVRGDDNRIYFLQSDRVLVYSVTGDLIRELRFEKPDKDMRTTRLDVSDGLLSIEFAKPFEKQTPRGMLRGIAKSFLLVNAADSRITSYYLPDEELGNNCVCFDRKQGYTFFWIDDGMIKLVHAPLK